MWLSFSIILYCSGFHLSEIIDFLGRSQLVEPAFVEAMRTSLANGKSLSGILSDLGFSDQVTTIAWQSSMEMWPLV